MLIFSCDSSSIQDNVCLLACIMHYAHYALCTLCIMHIMHYAHYAWCCLILLDTAWYCLILPDTTRYCLIRLDTAWYCLILLDTAWYCLILPDTAWYCLILPDTTRYDACSMILALWYLLYDTGWSTGTGIIFNLRAHSRKHLMSWERCQNDCYVWTFWYLVQNITISLIEILNLAVFRNVTFWKYIKIPLKILASQNKIW